MSNERLLLRLLTQLEEAIRTDNVEMHELVEQVREAAEQEIIVTDMCIDTPVRQIPFERATQKVWKEWEYTGENKVTLTIRTEQHQYMIVSNTLPTITTP